MPRLSRSSCKWLDRPLHHKYRPSQGKPKSLVLLYLDFLNLVAHAAVGYRLAGAACRVTGEAGRTIVVVGAPVCVADSVVADPVTQTNTESH